jgi:hypothetical protein
VGEMRNRIILISNLKEETHLENLGMDGKIVLKTILKKQDGKFVGWIHLARGKHQWRTQ